MASSGSSTTEIELDDRATSASSDRQADARRLSHIVDDRTSTENREDGPQIPPADHGREAWKLLCAAYVFEALMWGFPLSFGVFQDYYSQIPEFNNNPYVSVVGTVASGLGYLGAPLVTPLVRRYSKYRRHMILVGWPICILGLVAGSFAKTLPTLILTQGVMYGTGFLIFYYGIISMVDEFWIARRGMAYGVLCSASGVSGIIMPIVIQALLRKYGYPTTLRAIAVALTMTTGPMIPFLKGRLPMSDRSVSVGKTDWSFVRKPLFWIYTISNVVQGLGYFFPALFLPSYATSIGLTSLQGALLLTVMSVSQVLGQSTFGYLSDRKIPLNILITISLVVSSTATFALWGIARSMAPLIVFAILFGFFAAGYTALWARMVSAVSEEQSAALAMFSVFCFGKGVGNILAGPISAGLLLPNVRIGSYGALRYQPVVLFTGAAMFLSAICIFPWYLRRR